jgi:hypothetical protein
MGYPIKACNITIELLDKKGKVLNVRSDIFSIVYIDDIPQMDSYKRKYLKSNEKIKLISPYKNIGETLWTK